MKYQVINYKSDAHRCSDQIKSLGFFDTKEQADKFASNIESFGGKIIVRIIKK